MDKYASFQIAKNTVLQIYKIMIKKTIHENMLRSWPTLFLAATKQLYKWYFPSVCLSVCHTFFIMFPSSYHHEIFSSYYQWQK